MLSNQCFRLAHVKLLLTNVNAIKVKLYMLRYEVSVPGGFSQVDHVLVY